MTRVAVEADLLRWARERAGESAADELARRFPKLPEWEAGRVQPTLNQLESFARAAHVPVGYLFLPQPPDERLPIPDFRTRDGRRLRRASPNLLDMIYACQERQDWYREFSLASRLPEADFVGSVTLNRRPEDVAAAMSARLRFDLAARAACRTWEDALRLFIAQAEGVGVLVMASGIVLSNTHRPLDIEEFRGFALADSRAPLVFINGTDTKSGQMFTLAHELAHIWRGASALSDAGAEPLVGFRREEVWCNAVAAELLVPLAALRPSLRPNEPLDPATHRLARQFKVSTLVMLRRLFDAGVVRDDVFRRAWGRERERLRALADARGTGGATSIGRRCPGSAGGSPARWRKAPSKARPSIATLFECSGWPRPRPSIRSPAKRERCCDPLPARHERLHPGAQSALRFRFPPGFLGLADRAKRGGRRQRADSGSCELDNCHENSSEELALSGPPWSFQP